MFCRTVPLLMKMEIALAKKTGDVFTKAKRSEVLSWMAESKYPV